MDPGGGSESRPHLFPVHGIDVVDGKDGKQGQRGIQGGAARAVTRRLEQRLGGGYKPVGGGAAGGVGVRQKGLARLTATPNGAGGVDPRPFKG